MLMFPDQSDSAGGEPALRQLNSATAGMAVGGREGGSGWGVGRTVWWVGRGWKPLGLIIGHTAGLLGHNLGCAVSAVLHLQFLSADSRSILGRLVPPSVQGHEYSLALGRLQSPCKIHRSDGHTDAGIPRFQIRG